MRATAAAAVISSVALLVACTSGTPDSPTVSAPSSHSTALTSPPVAPSGSSAAPAGNADWPAYHGDSQRSGVSASMPAATGTLAATQVALTGQVYASPIVVGSTVIVATERNDVYGLDLSGRQRWRQSLGSPTPRSALPCGNIDPLGITGTPVYDAASRSVFVVASIGTTVQHQLVSLDPATGAIRWRRSVDLPGTDAQAMQQRGALTVLDGRVWVPFGGLAGDCGAYKGRLVGVPTGNGDPIAYTVPTTREAGIWTPPGATSYAGQLLVAVGNGESVGGRYDYSDSVLRLAGNRLVDSFSPTSWASDNAADLDLGSQGPAVVGQWVFIAGKSGIGYVLRADRLGGIGGQVWQGRVCRSFGGTAVAGDTVYVPCTDGVRAVRISATGTASVRWHASASIAGSPVLGGGRVYALDQSAGVLYALDPATGAVREKVVVGAVSRFATPAIGGSVLYVPTLSGIAVVHTR
ncbi:MAG: PQQ-binding-like beta-propeller repeat protein [Jatrophihabitans sp.]